MSRILAAIGWAVAVVAPFCCDAEPLLCGPFVPALPSIAGLEAAQVLQITYTSVGCFHHHQARFELTRTPDDKIRAHIVVLRPPWGSYANSKDLILADDDIAALDTELAYRRNPIDAGCTTVDFFDVVLTQAGRELSREALRDESCEIFTSRFASLLQDDAAQPISKKLLLRSELLEPFRNKPRLATKSLTQ